MSRCETVGRKANRGRRSEISQSSFPELLIPEEKELILGEGKSPLFPTSDPSPADLADREAFIERLCSWHSEPDRSHLARFLRANPGMTVRDWKGKGPVVPAEPVLGEKPWHRLKPEQVRHDAIRATARDLPRNVRQAAARDPGLIWNPLARKYRLRLPSEPAGEEGKGA
jgi:hypothetical protein